MKNIGKTLAECVRPADLDDLAKAELIDGLKAMGLESPLDSLFFRAEPKCGPHYSELWQQRFGRAMRPMPAPKRQTILALCDSIEANQRAIDETVAAMRRLCE